MLSRAFMYNHFELFRLIETRVLHERNEIWLERILVFPHRYGDLFRKSNSLASRSASHRGPQKPAITTQMSAQRKGACRGPFRGCDAHLRHIGTSRCANAQCSFRRRARYAYHGQHEGVKDADLSGI